MKIWIAWTFSSGKTTLAKQFQNHIIDVEREMMRKPVAQMSKQELIEYQKKVMNKQIERETQMESFITDTPLYVCLAYVKNIWDEGLENRAIDRVTMAAKYDLIFLCEPLPIVNDGIRHIDVEFQKRIHLDIVKTLYYYWQSCILLSWTVQERVKQIQSYLVR